jgi:hypothetical protein
LNAIAHPFPFWITGEMIGRCIEQNQSTSGTTAVDPTTAAGRTSC